MTQSLSTFDINIFMLLISNFRFLKKCIQKFVFDASVLILLTFIESLEVILINVIATLMMSRPVWRKIFHNKGYEVTISVKDFTKKLSSCDSDHIVEVVMWRKFGNSSFSRREVIITYFFLRISPEKLMF